MILRKSGRTWVPASTPIATVRPVDFARQARPALTELQVQRMKASPLCQAI